MKCDDSSLHALLDGEDGNTVFLEVAEHVESCRHCQLRLEQLAADGEQWQEVQHWLAFDAQDDAGGETAAWRERARLRRPTAWTESMAELLLAPPKHPEMLGRIGRYDVERLIGSGGMGVVFKAFDTELNRSVAVKVLAPYLAGNGAARSRFAREARAAAAVVDEHVVAIHNVESDGDAPFLVMKYIPGGSLQTRLDRDGPLDVREILRIGMHTAHGLAAAHAQGLIHRDVKPSNILLDEGVDRALLTDFGLARASDDASLTHTGYHPGTPQYMSPEQARGDAVDARTDLFSLGSVMYTMCTGRTPFRAETSYGILRRITDTQPRPIREINPEVPDWLAGIVDRLHAKSPEDRFDSAGELHRVLEECLAHVQQPTTVPLPKCCRDSHLNTQRTNAGGSTRSWKHHDVRFVTALTVIGTLGLLSAPAWLANRSDDAGVADTSRTAETATPQGPIAVELTPTAVSPADPATEWDASADEIASLQADWEPFESRAQYFWDLQPELKEE